ncbi:MAG TPA: carboxypeptidase-like regulatory domain-containing protein, partial [Bryobacteraceae bacterium]
MSLKRPFLYFLLALAVCTPLHADVTATILGNARDSTGAPLPNAKITVTNQETNLSRTTITDPSGEYRFLSLPIGTYTVEAELTGFQKFVASNIVLTVDQQRRVDIAMQVGSVQQSVEVSAAAVQVETTNTQLGTVIDDKNIVNLPLNGRSYIDLLSIQAGVAPASTSGAQPGLLSVNGQRQESNSFLVNGGDVNEGRRMSAGVVPNLDAVAEFRLITNSFDA